MSDVTAFAIAIQELQPGATGSDIAALLDHKAKRTTVLEWKAGRKHAPRWALELLAAKIHARASVSLSIAARLRAVPDRPGKQAGARNLAAWRAAQNR